MRRKNKKVKPLMFTSFKTENGVFKTLLTKKFSSRKPYLAKDKKKINAIISGTIVKIYVNEGDAVKEGAKLLVLEAMKMKNYILSPIKGKIKDIHIKEGDNVSKDKLLIEFE